jgi:tripartite-type tricarboxylate transporter receptor subunit TctC
MTRALFAIAFLLTAGVANAQGFPTKQVTVIIGVAPGGTLDTLARQIATGLSPLLKQPVVVENVTGAGGLVGFQRLMKADPDGHTLNFSNMSLLIIPHMHPKGGFDPLADLAPVTGVATVPMVMAVSNKSGIKDLPSLIAHMRRNPGKVNLGNGGPGTTAHLSQSLFLSIVKADAQLIQYRGSGPVLADLMSGVVDGMIDQTVTLMPLHNTKRAHAIAVTASQRLAQMPDVPTFAEGGVPEFDLRIWNGYLAPKGTPRAALERLSAAISQVIDSPEYKDRVEKQLASEIPTPAERGPDAFRRLLEKDAARVSALVKAIGLKPAE